MIWVRQRWLLILVLLVIALGLLLHRPVASIPENTLKFIVGGLLTAFGTFWLGEGIGVSWPGADWSLLVLVGGYLIIALLCVRMAKFIARRAVSLRRLAVIAWALGGVIFLRVHLLDPRSEAVMLAVGIAVLLAENVGRTARAHASSSGTR